MPQLRPPHPLPLDSCSLPLDDINVRLAAIGMPSLSALDVGILRQFGSPWIAGLASSVGASQCVKVPTITNSDSVAARAGISPHEGRAVAYPSRHCNASSHRSRRDFVSQRGRIVPAAAAARMHQKLAAVPVVLCIEVVSKTKPVRSATRPDTD